MKLNFPKTSDVILKIGNGLGKEVTAVVSDRLRAGYYTYQWQVEFIHIGCL